MKQVQGLLQIFEKLFLKYGADDEDQELTCTIKKIFPWKPLTDDLSIPLMIFPRISNAITKLDSSISIAQK